MSFIGTECYYTTTTIIIQILSNDSIIVQLLTNDSIII